MNGFLVAMYLIQAAMSNPSFKIPSVLPPGFHASIVDPESPARRLSDEHASAVSSTTVHHVSLKHGFREIDCKSKIYLIPYSVDVVIDYPCFWALAKFQGAGASKWIDIMVAKSGVQISLTGP